MIRVNFNYILLSALVYLSAIILVMSHYIGYDILVSGTILLNLLNCLRIVLSGGGSSQKISFSVSFAVLFCFPSIALATLDRYSSFELVIITIIIIDLFLFFGGGDAKAKPENEKYIYTSRLKILFYATGFWIVAAPFIIKESTFITYIIPLSIYVTLSECIFKREGGGAFFLISSFAFLIGFILQVAIHWSGYGRLVIGAYVIFTASVYLRYYDFKFRIWQTFLLLPVALYFAQISRYGEVSDLRGLFLGSAGHHIIVTYDAFHSAGRGNYAGLSDYFGQLSLMIIGWFPRTFWPDKPNGAGFDSVEVMYGREGLAENYTQSLGFLGDQIYLLGPYYLLGLSLTIIVLILLRRLIRRLSAGYYSPLAAFDVSMISFLWGGMAIFGQRAWFLIVPSLVVILLVEKSSRKYKSNSTTKAP